MSEISLYDKVQVAAAFLKPYVDGSKAALVLGTGMQSVLDDLEVHHRIAYADIPHFVQPTVVSHGSEVLVGRLRGQQIVALTGRFHYYEGYTMQEVTFSTRVIAALGMDRIIMTNITGSVHPAISIGDIVAIKDHINLQSANPLRGLRDDRLGPRFPSMLNAYDPAWIRQTISIAETHQIKVHQGVYCAMDGPSLETPAEYQMIRQLGGDVVGMSTVPEVIVAKQCGLKTLVLSIVSNICTPDHLTKEDDIDQILANVKIGAPGLSSIIKDLVAELK